MKALKFLALTLSLVLTTAQIVEANGGVKLTPEAELRQEVVKLIAKVNVSLVSNDDRKATVEFLITRDNKIVVLDVDTNSNVLERAIKLILNYHKVNVLGIQKMTAFRMDVTYNKAT